MKAIYLLGIVVFLLTSCKTTNHQGRSTIHSIPQESSLTSPIPDFVAYQASGRSGVNYPVYLDHAASHSGVSVYTPFGSKKDKPVSTSFMDLRLAKALTLSFREINKQFGVDGITHWGIYVTEVCNDDGCREKTGQHPKGLGIDIASLHFSNGTELQISRDWLRNKEPDENTEKLVAIRDIFCKYLDSSLNPYSNADHADHYHLDLFSGTADNHEMSQEFENLPEKPASLSLTSVSNEPEVLGKLNLTGVDPEIVRHIEASDSYGNDGGSIELRLAGQPGCGEYYKGQRSKVELEDDSLRILYEKRTLDVFIKDNLTAKSLSKAFKGTEKQISFSSQNGSQNILLSCNTQSDTYPCQLKITNITADSTPFKFQDAKKSANTYIVRADNDNEYMIDSKQIFDGFNVTLVDDSDEFINGRDPEIDVGAPGNTGFAIPSDNNAPLQIRCRTALPDGASYYCRIKIKKPTR